MGVFSLYTAGNLGQGVPDYRVLNPTWPNSRSHILRMGKSYTCRGSPVKNRDLESKYSGF